MPVYSSKTLFLRAPAWFPFLLLSSSLYRSLFCNEHLFAFIALQMSFPFGHEVHLVKDMSKSIVLRAFISNGFSIQK